MKNWLLAIPLLFGVVGVWAGQPPDHKIVSGDTLGKIAQQYGYGMKRLCVFNGLTNCNLIKKDEMIKFPARDAVSAKPPKAKPAEASCVNLGVAPFNPEGKLSIALQGVDLLPLTDAQKIEAKELIAMGVPTEKSVLLTVDLQARYDMLFRSNVTGKPVLLKDRQLCDPNGGARAELGDIYRLKDGTEIVDPRVCHNLSVVRRTPKGPPVVVRQEPQPEPEPQVEPEPQPEPTPVEEVSVSPPLVAESLEEEPAPICLFDPKLVGGQEHEPERAGNDAHSSNVRAALFCTWRGEGGTHGVGFGLSGAWWKGHVNHGAGKFSGRMLAAGPGYEFISDNGWNVEGNVLFGRIHEDFKQAQFQSGRAIDFVGPSASLNLGQRRARGEKFLPETRIYAMAGFKRSVDAHTSNFGQPADASDTARFGSLFQAGIHQDVYDFESFTLWMRAGYFRETPFSETANLRIGVSDPWRMCGIGPGYDFDLLHGGKAKAWGWWCDGMKAIDVGRAEYRLSQVIKETGATFEEDGTLFVPMPPAKPD